MSFLVAPAHTRLHVLMYVCLLLNHLASVSLGWKSPVQILTGQHPDISKFMHFSFYEPKYYHSHSNTFLSASNEEQGWWVGVATHVGDALTYKILTKQNKVINFPQFDQLLTLLIITMPFSTWRGDGIHLSRWYNVHLFQAPTRCKS
jgi:hypothetical protein